MTTMIDRPETVAESRLEQMQAHNANLRTTVAVLVIIAVALGGWILFDYLGEAEVAPSSAVSQLVDDYTQAWNEYDEAAFLELTTAGYRFEAAGGMDYRQADQANQIGSVLPRFAWNVERLAAPMVTGDDPYYVSWPIRVTTNIREAEGIAILTVVSDGDGYLVSRHVVIGDF